MKRLLHKLSGWLWIKTHTITATEIMMLREADNPRRCEHCKLPIEHQLENCACRNLIL